MPPLPTPHRALSFFLRARSNRKLHTSPLPQSKPTPPAPSQTEKDDYYALLLSQPLPSSTSSSTTPRSSAPKSPEAQAQSQPQEQPTPAQILFGTPLAGPSAARRRAGYGETPQEPGLHRPAEPDNCCMSGCVNCVWDAYREEVEAWAARRREEEAKLAGGATRGGDVMDGYLNGEEEVERARGMRGRGMRGKGKRVKEKEEERLFEGVPVGIREFMGLEKRLREEREGRREMTEE